MELKDKIRKYALQNAVKFNGKANPGAVIGKLIADDVSVKSKMKDVSKDVQDVIKELNKINLKEQEEELRRIDPGFFEQKKTEEEKKVLPPLENAVKGKIVMRFAPSPSGPLHIGHTIPLGLTYMYCKMYDGKLILRIEDTNPENIYTPAYEMIPENANWLTGNAVKEVIIQSDRMKTYYRYIEELINKNAAYVCECKQEEYKKLIDNMQECPCRELGKKEQMKRWKKMLKKEKGYKEGEAVVRVKTDVKHKNPAMRDFPIARINEETHPKQKKKYRVWPLMNLAVFVDDVELGMTHIIRGKDHADNAKRQEYMYKYLKKEVPFTYFHGRVNFTDLEVSCSKTKKAIAEGKFTGWDDIKLPFLAALRKRGYQPGAFLKWVESIGVSLSDKTVSKEEAFKIINFFNKEIIDSSSDRYFFIEDPKKIKIVDCRKFDVELDLHPDYKKGGRKFEIDGNFYLDKGDYKDIKDGKLVRLMDCLNFVKKSGKLKFDSVEYETYKEKGKMIIHWLPVVKELVKVEIVMPCGTVKKGLAEPLVGELKEGAIVQFERFGFCRLDEKKKGKLVFWFGHR